MCRIPTFASRTVAAIRSAFASSSNSDALIELKSEFGLDLSGLGTDDLAKATRRLGSVTSYNLSEVLEIRNVTALRFDLASEDAIMLRTRIIGFAARAYSDISLSHNCIYLRCPE